MRKKIKRPKKISLEKILLAIFILLLVLVISLFVYYITMDKNSTVENEISFPLIADVDPSSSISLASISKDKDVEYLFEISNFKDDNFNPEVNGYIIELLNPVNYDLKIELYKYEDKEYKRINLDEELKSDSIEFKTGKEETHNYKIIIKSDNELEDFAMLGLNIIKN